ncbi:hypothetical protein BgiBS90_021002, partial [Biomphalaria glabrata]
ESKSSTSLKKALNDKCSDVVKGKEKPGNFQLKSNVTININKTWTETSIAQKILHSYL